MGEKDANGAVDSQQKRLDPSSPTVAEFERTLETLRGAGSGIMNADEDAAVKEFEDSLKRTVEDEEKSKKIQKQLENLEEEIRKKEKLAEQNREFDKKMEQHRRERKEMQKLADEEFQELRRQMQLEIAAFLACLQLKQRFLEKKEEWEEFLKKLRQLLVKIINSYYDFQKEIKDFDPTDEFLQGFVDNEGKMFAKKIDNAQHMFSNAFNDMKTSMENYDDRIFIKMIMKSISKQAHLCNDVGEELVRVLEQKSKDIKKLNELVSRLDPQGIPTTGKLTKESLHAREEDYVNIEDVPLPEWFRHFM